MSCIKYVKYVWSMFCVIYKLYFFLCMIKPWSQVKTYIYIYKYIYNFMLVLSWTIILWQYHNHDHWQEEIIPHKRVSMKVTGQVIITTPYTQGKPTELFYSACVCIQHIWSDTNASSNYSPPISSPLLPGRTSNKLGIGWDHQALRMKIMQLMRTS